MPEDDLSNAVRETIELTEQTYYGTQRHNRAMHDLIVRNRTVMQMVIERQEIMQPANWFVLTDEIPHTIPQTQTHEFPPPSPPPAPEPRPPIQPMVPATVCASETVLPPEMAPSEKSTDKDDKGDQSKRIPKDWDMRFAWPPIWDVFYANDLVDFKDGHLSSVQGFLIGATDYPLEGIEEYCDEWIDRHQKYTSRALTKHPALWLERDRAKENHGTLKKSPWSSGRWGKNGGGNIKYFIKHTEFTKTYIDEKNPNNIRYYESLENAVRGRLTSSSPGRFLSRFMSHIPEADRAALVAAYLHKPSDDIEIGFARTRDEIEHVYLHGPGSCMSEPRGSYVCTAYMHPTSIYADAGMSVAWARKKECTSYLARCVVHEERKAAVRVYPGSDYARSTYDESRLAYFGGKMLYDFLQKEGFSIGDSKRFVGIEFPAIKLGEQEYIAPYLDIGLYLRPVIKDDESKVLCIGTENIDGFPNLRSPSVSGYICIHSKDWGKIKNTMKK